MSPQNAGHYPILKQGEKMKSLLLKLILLTLAFNSYTFFAQANHDVDPNELSIADLFKKGHGLKIKFNKVTTPKFGNDYASTCNDNISILLSHITKDEPLVFNKKTPPISLLLPQNGRYFTAKNSSLIKGILLTLNYENQIKLAKDDWGLTFEDELFKLREENFNYDRLTVEKLQKLCEGELTFEIILPENN